MATLKQEPITLIWHRRDLRLDDHSLYHNRSGKIVSCVILSLKRLPSIACADFDMLSIGPHFGKTYLEAVADLRSSLQSRGGEILIRTSTDSVQTLIELAREIQCTEVAWMEEPGTWESKESRRLQQAIRSQLARNVRITTDVCYSMWHPNDLPADEEHWRRLAQPKQKFKSNKSKKQKESSPTQSSFHSIIDVTPDRFGGMPQVMGDFRRAARTATTIREPLVAPQSIQLPLYIPDAGTIPTLEEWFGPILQESDRPIMGVSPENLMTVVRTLDREVRRPRGGESVAKARLRHLLQDTREKERAKADVLTNDDSSQLSRHLVMGTLSPRRVVKEIHGLEHLTWLTTHLEMRDFFLYYCWKNGAKMYQLDGLPVCSKPLGHPWKSPRDLTEEWKAWSTGHTGFPLVDAAARQLQEGYISNRVRQNLASFLTRDLHLDWRAGAEYFQLWLEDFCVAANWGNWMYFSGVGPDPKSRHFRTVSQAKRYDANGEYVKRFVEELDVTCGPEQCLRPWDLVDDYPKPIINPASQYTWQDLQELNESGRICEKNT